MRAAIVAVLAMLAAVPGASAQGKLECPGGGLGVQRIVEIDTSAGPLYGDITKYAKEERFLAPREVVLTFDDGPMPWITKSILDTLDRFCTKATFFSVGRMALAYPASVKEVLARGHTLGGHTHTHPLNIARLKSERAIDEIERGFAAIALAAGQPIAPFFRFPGLSDSPALLDHLQKRGIAAFTVDVVSNDSFINDPGRLARLTLERIEAQRGGIVLFHDIKSATAKALPHILAELKARGYKVVHMRSKAPLAPVASYETELLPKLARTSPRQEGKPALVPFYGSVGPEPKDATAAAVDAREAPAGGEIGSGAVAASLEVTALAPPARQRLAALDRTIEKRAADGTERTRPRQRTDKRGTVGTPYLGSATERGWATEIRPNRRAHGSD